MAHREQKGWTYFILKAPIEELFCFSRKCIYKLVWSFKKGPKSDNMQGPKNIGPE